jgi:hypothetical protein
VTVSVLVPYRPDSPERARAWRWVRSWWADHHPDWQVVAGSGPSGPWRKALAVADALARADGDLLVIADADVVSPGVFEAVAQVVQAGAAWAIPHGSVHRLSEAATVMVYDGTPPDRAAELGGYALRAASAAPALPRQPYVGVEGGGMLVLPRATYERAPLDPRFAGWGGEDEAHARALVTLAGRPWRGTAPLWHLYHPLAERLNEHVGNAESHALLVRYQYAAKAGPEAMAALVAEAASVAA